MFQQELEELLSLSEADKLGKEYYERTGIVLSGEVIDEAMIQRLMKAGGLEHYMDIQKEGLDALILAASKVIHQETPFFYAKSDVSVRKSMRYFAGFHHTHDYFEIQCVLEGNAEYATALGNIPIQKNDLVLVPPNTDHCIYDIKEGTIINFGIRKSTFEIAFRDILSSNLPISVYFKNAMTGQQNNEIFFRNALDEFSLQLLLMMYHQQKLDTNESKKINDHLAQSFIYYIAEKSTTDSIFGSAEYMKDKIWDIRMHMIENYKTITLSSLANHFHYSESYLSRFILRQLGLNFSQLLQEIRLEKSCQLLIEIDMKITELCENVGYNNESYYINIFRKKYGVTPLQFRKMHQK